MPVERVPDHHALRSFRDGLPEGSYLGG